MKWIIGSVVILIGYILVWKSDWFMNNVGRVEWAEQHLGTEGGSRLFYKLLGLLVIVLTLFAWTDILGAILRGIFGPMANSLNNS